MKIYLENVSEKYAFYLKSGKKLMNLRELTKALDMWNYYADLNSGGNLGGNWKFSGKIATNGYDPNTNSKGWNWGMGVRTWDVFAEGSIFAKSQMITDGPIIAGGDISAPNNVREGCYWTPNTPLNDIDTSFGTGSSTCPEGYFIAGIGFKNGGENDELDMWQLYCCKI